MRVVGTSTHHEARVVAEDAPFKINELLIIDDPLQGPVRVEVIETASINPHLAETERGLGLVDDATLGALKALGYDLQRETYHLARVRALSELAVPVAVGAAVRRPSFDEVRDLIMPGDPASSFLLGVIRGTEHLLATLPRNLRNVAPLFDPREGAVRPQSGVPFYLPFERMVDYPHIGIFGGSGSGKSFALRVLLEELMAQKLPALVFDPHYELDFGQPLPGTDPARCAALQGRFRIFQLGRDTGIRFENLSTGELVLLLQAAMREWSDNMRHAVETLHIPGDSVTSFRDRLNDLAAALVNEREFKELASREQEGELPPPSEPAARVKLRQLAVYRRYGGAGLLPTTLAALVRRLDLLDRMGVFGSDLSQVERSLVAGQTAVVRGPVRPLNVFATYAVRYFYRLRRAYCEAKAGGSARPDAFFPPFFVVIDEAHNLMPRAVESEHAPARGLFREVATEGRKFCVQLVLASQRVALLDETITAQLNTKIILRTIRAQDLDTIERETDITRAEVNRLPYLASGNAFVSSAIIGRTVPVRIRASWTRSPLAESPFEEWRRVQATAGEDLWEIIKEKETVRPGDLLVLVNECQARLGRPVSREELERALERWAQEGRLAARVVRSLGGTFYTRV